MSSTTPCFTAYMQYGDNSTSTLVPVPEYGIKDSSNTSVTTSQKQWDATMSGGFDSGVVPVSLSANVGGGTNGVAWTVTGGVTVPLTSSAVSYAAIQKVRVLASVNAGGHKIAFTDAIVRFYVDSSLKQQLSLGSGTGPTADTLGLSGMGAEMAFVATPTRTDINRVTVDANVQMEADEDAPPDPQAIVGAIEVYTTSCNP